MHASDLPAASAHILIAEDSGVQAFMLRHILSEQGYETSIVNNGLLALEMAERLRPALIVSDVNMPGMGGYELCRRIKADPDLGTTPVILVTSLSGPDDVLLGLKSGADSFVIKPYDKSHLLARVAHALERPPARTVADGDSGEDIIFHGEKHRITASRAQILNLLMSTYDATVQRNKELHDSRRQLAERTAEMLAANRFLDSIIENIPDMVFIKDAAELKFVQLNRAGEELIGLLREQMLGKSDHDFFPRQQSDFFVAKDREVLASRGQMEISEEPIQTMGKGVRLLRTKKVAVLNEHGEPTHLLGISEDVTVQRQMENEISKLNDSLTARAAELEASNKSLESFTSAATHDLRSPLSVIGGYASMLEKKYAQHLDQKGQHYLAVISTTIKSMAKLIDDLLAFSRLGQSEISKTAVNVHELVQHVIHELLHHVPDGKKPVIELGHLPPAPADAALLRQVWVNLLSNAAKYSRDAKTPLIRVSGRVEGTEVIYAVQDNGAGFSMQEYDKLFEMFQRLHTDQQFEGTGVGLPIVQRIVTRHGGRVWAEGKIGQGAVFYFALPA